MTMEQHALAVARATKGFMPEDEGLALHEAGLDGGRVGPLLEIGSYCGKSAVYLGSAAAELETVLFTIDHHHGSEENQAGWEHHDVDVVDASTGRMDTLPFFRRTIEDAGLEAAVVAIVGDSPTVGRFWSTPVGLLFIDGGHAEAVAMADYEGWARFVVAGGASCQNVGPALLLRFCGRTELVDEPFLYQGVGPGQRFRDVGKHLAIINALRK